MELIDIRRNDCGVECQKNRSKLIITLIRSGVCRRTAEKFSQTGKIATENNCRLDCDKCVPNQKNHRTVLAQTKWKCVRVLTHSAEFLNV